MTTGPHNQTAANRPVRARAVANAVFLEHIGASGDIASWGEPDHERAVFVADQINALLQLRDPGELERLLRTNRDHEAQLIRIANYFGKDARHAKDGTIAGMVIEEVEALQGGR